MTSVQVLGPGCRRCHALAAVTREAGAALGLDVRVEEVTDVAEMARMGVMSTPALVIDGRVAVAGSVPGQAQVEDLLAAAG